VYLVDTSAWIAHFSRNDPFDLRSICAADERVLCPPIYQELLQGIRREDHLRRIRRILSTGLFVESPMPLDLFDQAANLYRTARRHGLTVRSSIDCLIAQSAIRSNLIVLHRDRDFPSLAGVSMLRQQPLGRT